MLGRSPKLIKERRIYIVNHSRDEAQLELLEQFHQLFAIHQLDRWNTITNSFGLRVLGKYSCRQNDSLVGTALDSPTKIANVARSDCPRIPLALKQNLKLHECVDFNYAVAINPAVTTAACHFDFFKSRLSQKSLAESLKTYGRQFS